MGAIIYGLYCMTKKNRIFKRKHFLPTDLFLFSTSATSSSVENWP